MSGQIVGQSDITTCRISSGGREEKELKDEERRNRQNQELLDQLLQLVFPATCPRQAASLSQGFNNMGLVYLEVLSPCQGIGREKDFVFN